MSLDRRRWMARALAAGAAAALAGCDRLSETPKVRRVLESAEALNLRLQRLLTHRTALATEYGAADISPDFRANGETDPWMPWYRRMAADGFADWRLEVGGLVERPLRLSLAQVRALPARSQITRHDCVEGWSSIGQWKGARLGPLLRRAGLKPEARYIVFHCADLWERVGDGGSPYYESIDLVDAFHPQTILAYEMNGRTLPVAHGAPVRLRVERQLGYKHAKYVMRIEVVESFAHIGSGKGGFWPDRGYEWYAGI